MKLVSLALAGVIGCGVGIRMTAGQPPAEPPLSWGDQGDGHFMGMQVLHSRDLVKLVERWEAPCPFWDDDGRAYLVHSHRGAGPLIVHRMAPDGTRLLDDGVEIYRGPVAEGPKLFKRRGWYYISLPEGGVSQGGQTVLRAREVAGPYERREVLPASTASTGRPTRTPGWRSS